MSPRVAVSVIMPFLNAEPFLEEAIESVRAQELPDWELLLCDDGSTDGSSGIAQRYAELDPARIRRLTHPDHGTHGASAARNLGLAIATGEFIALLDADDVWLPNKLVEQVPLLTSHPDADVLFGSTEFWYGWTGRGEDAARDHVVRIGIPHGSVVRPPALLQRMIMGSIAVPSTCSLLARREAVARIGGFETAFRRVFTDQVFYTKLFVQSSVLIVDTCWNRYRQHDASSCVTSARTGEFAATKLEFLRWARRYSQERGLNAPELMLAFRWAAWRVRHPRLAQGIRRVRHTYYRAASAVRRTVGR